MGEETEKEKQEGIDAFYNLGVLREVFPAVADRIAKEYRRVGGFIPYQPGYVYAIKACGSDYYKLGKSINPDQRLLQIAPKMPFETRFVRVWRTNFMDLAEKWLHKNAASCRANGEWFKFQEATAADLFVRRAAIIDEQIRNAYGSYFFDHVVQNRCLFSVLNQPILPIDGLESRFGVWGGSPNSIAWIDGLFHQLGKEEMPLPSDFSNAYETALAAYKNLPEHLKREVGS